MSSSFLENPSYSFRGAGQRILTLIKTRGRLTAQEIGLLLGTTGEAARQQLVKLAGEGLVELTSEARGVGRPTQYWSLTSEGNAHFPDTHAELTAQLIRTIRTELGEDEMQKLIGAREAEARANYERLMADAKTLEARVARLTEIRTEEGYMAQWEKTETGYLLIENHCPIAVAATTCNGFCGAELNLFREVLGPNVIVERTEHIVSGSRRCAYKIEVSD